LTDCILIIAYCEKTVEVEYEEEVVVEEEEEDDDDDDEEDEGKVRFADGFFILLPFRKELSEARS
jgi:hypothetical protein